MAPDTAVLSARRALPWLFAAVVGHAGHAAGCAPDPLNVACANDGACQRVDDDLRYCLESRCVECISHASCGEGNTCVDGRCSIRCRDTRDCRSGEICRQGTCEAR